MYYEIVIVRTIIEFLESSRGSILEEPHITLLIDTNNRKTEKLHQTTVTALQFIDVFVTNIPKLL